MKKNRLWINVIGVSSFLIVLSFLIKPAYSQDVPAFHQKFVSFPYPMDRPWKASIGFSLTTLAQDVTEEQHLRVPCGDFHILKKLSHNSYLDGRINFQVFQNMITLGPRWAFPLNDRLSMSLGNDLGYWFGFINVEGFKTVGHGFQNYPNVSLGYRFNKSILLTVKAEAIMTLSMKARTGGVPVTSDNRFFSGSSFTATLEQPFYGNKSLSLGFRFLYTDFFWQTWALFETFDRNIFYPQLLIGFIF